MHTYSNVSFQQDREKPFISQLIKQLYQIYYPVISSSNLSRQIPHELSKN